MRETAGRSDLFERTIRRARSAIENTFPRNEVSAVNEQLPGITGNFVYAGRKFYWSFYVEDVRSLQMCKCDDSNNIFTMETFVKVC